MPPSQNSWGGAQNLDMCLGPFRVCENHPSHAWQLRKGWEVRDQLLARGAEDKGMQEDAGKWSAGKCPMSDLAERRAVPQIDPSSFLCQDPGLGTQCRKSDQVLQNRATWWGPQRWKAQNIPQKRSAESHSLPLLPGQDTILTEDSGSKCCWEHGQWHPWLLSTKNSRIVECYWRFHLGQPLKKCDKALRCTSVETPRNNNGGSPRYGLRV